MTPDTCHVYRCREDRDFDLMKHYTSLANAIVLQAVEDYRKAMRTLAKHPSDRNAETERNSILEFFRSEYFGILTDIDPEVLIKRLNKEVA